MKKFIITVFSIAVLLSLFVGYRSFQKKSTPVATEAEVEDVWAEERVACEKNGGVFGIASMGYFHTDRCRVGENVYTQDPGLFYEVYGEAKYCKSKGGISQDHPDYYADNAACVLGGKVFKLDSIGSTTIAGVKEKPYKFIYDESETEKYQCKQMKNVEFGLLPSKCVKYFTDNLKNI